MIDLTKLSGYKLREILDKRSRDESAICDELIAAGMGHMRGSEIRELAKGSSLLAEVKLARRFVAVRDAWNEANEELAARRRYHGGDNPIRRREI